MTPVFIFWGGGVQTTALAILQVHGRVPAVSRLGVMADTLGEKLETYAYLRDVFQPWADQNDFELRLIRRDDEGLYEYALARRMVPSINTRWCTSRFKIDPINRWLKEHGASRQSPATIQIGISADEAQRAKPAKRGRSYVKRTYPLLDLGLTRHDCEQVIRDEGLPLPPKSGCWFCPYQRKFNWRQLHAEHPDLAAKALVLEDAAITRNPREMLGGYFRLRHLLGGGQQLNFDAVLENEEGCVSGVCFV